MLTSQLTPEPPRCALIGDLKLERAQSASEVRKLASDGYTRMEESAELVPPDGGHRAPLPGFRGTGRKECEPCLGWRRLNWKLAEDDRRHRGLSRRVHLNWPPAMDARPALGNQLGPVRAYKLDNEKKPQTNQAPMIDRGSSDRVAASRAISRPAAPNATGTWLALGLVLVLAASAAHAHPSDGWASKLELWSDLLAAHDSPTRAGGHSGLATRLAQHTDQRLAALLYIELLARLQVRTPASEWACRRVSLAELGASEAELEAGRADWATFAAGSERDQTELLAALESRALGRAARAAAQLAVENANLLSRLLLVHPSDEQPVQPLLVSRRFFSYLAERKLHLWQASELSKQVQVQSVGLVLLSPSSSALDLAVIARLGPRRVELQELGEQQALTPPVNRWLRAELGELARLSTAPSELQLEHGHWSSPYFDCGLSNRWTLTYSIPLFGASSRASEQRAELRGVSFVSLDLARLGLIDQCAGDPNREPAEPSGGRSRHRPTSSLFANTHRCARLEQSQCTSLSDPEQVRAGAYVCRCPEGGRLSQLQSSASENYRRRLKDQLETNATTIDYLERLLVEPPEAELARALDRLVGLSDHQWPIKQAGSILTFGYQLETDVALEWLADPPNPGWPRQVCNRCLTGNGTSERDRSQQEQQLQVVDGKPECEPEDNFDNPSLDRSSSRRAPSSSNWSRPLVGALESLCVLVTLLLLAVLLRVSRSRIILVAGLLMLETMLVGALLLYLSVLVRFLGPSSIACLLEPWFRELGFSIFYGSILIKLYHILTEFQTRKAHRVCFRDKDQIVHLLAIVLIVVGYMSAWTALMVDNFLFGHQKSIGRPAGVGSEKGAIGFELSSPGAISYELPPDNRLMNERQDGGQHNYSLPEFFVDNFSRSGTGASSNATTSKSNLELVAASFGLAPDQLRLMLAKNLNSFSDLFSGLLESRPQFDAATNSLAYSVRCRKLTWDYVTELSEMGLLIFGIYLVYKIRNAKTEVQAEKLFLGAPVCLELIVSSLLYAVRHIFWNQLSPDQFLIMLCLRSLLCVALGTGLIVGPRLYNIVKSKPSLLFGGSISRAAGGSIRHRCHLTCEIHDHHLNDAMRLHQAMLSNTALEVGSIGLADMDPEEIQAELKRVYTQLELLKTKAMRRDNPHISKRRGGRKTGHRKFSLQAFHPKHLAGQASGGDHVLGSSGLESSLAVVPENEPPDEPEQGASAAETSRPLQKLEGKATGPARQRNQPHGQRQNRRPSQARQPRPSEELTSVEPTSISSVGVYINYEDAHEDDSQSSAGANTSPQRPSSSFVCSQSSIHPDSSVN